MTRQAFKILTILSAGLLLATLLLFIIGYALNPSDHHVSFGDACHIGVWNRGLDSRLVVFNNSDYGPYRGSIIGLVDGASFINCCWPAHKFFGICALGPNLTCTGLNTQGI